MKRTLIIILLIILLMAAGTGLYFFVKKDSTRNTSDSSSNEAGTIYTNTQSFVGGSCLYYEHNPATGKSLSRCVDGVSAQNAVAQLSDKDQQTAKTQYKRLLAITGTYHVRIESHSPTTPTPQHTDWEVIYFDSIQQVELSQYEVQ